MYLVSAENSIHMYINYKIHYKLKAVFALELLLLSVQHVKWTEQDSAADHTCSTHHGPDQT